MASTEVFDYIVEGVKWLSIGGTTYASLIAVSMISHACSPRIKTQKELEGVVREEAKKLGIRDKITPILVDETKATAKKVDKKSYELEVGRFGANRRAVKNELYKIHTKYFTHPWKQAGGKKKALHYLFLAEPRSILYETLSLRL